MKLSLSILTILFAISFSGCEKGDHEYEDFQSQSTENVSDGDDMSSEEPAFSNKGVKYEYTGEITGPDYRKCACCGGFFMKFKDVDEKGNIITRTHNFYKLPVNANFRIEDHQFPIPVKFNFHQYESPACQLIVLDDIELAK